MKYYADYLAIEDWEVLDTKECHFYNDDETTFGAICVKIGTITSVKGNTIEKNDIVRWISNSEYQRLRANCGVIVFQYEVIKMNGRKIIFCDVDQMGFLIVMPSLILC